MKKNTKQEYTLFLKLVVSSILLFFVFKIIGIDKIYSELKKAEVSYLFVVLVFVFFQLYFKSLKWRVIVKMFNAHISVASSFVYNCISLAFGFITPGRVGEFVKAKYLYEKANISKKDAVLTVVVDKLSDLFSIAVLAFVGMLLLSQSFPYSGLITIGIVAIFLFFLLSFGFVHLLPKLIPLKIAKRFELWIKAMAFTKRNYGKTILYSLFIWSIYVIEGYFILIALGISEPPLAALILVISLMALLSAVPISIGGIGVREVVAVYFLLLIGVPAEKSALFSILYTLISGGTPALIGAFLYIKEKDLL